MRLANRAGRAWLVDGQGRGADLAEASNGRFGPGPMDALVAWPALREWASASAPALGTPLDESSLGPPVPAPRAVYAIGLNYRDHAAEAGLDLPKAPMVFTKFPSCLCGPRADVWVFSERVDYEAELVVVIGREAQAVPESQALDFVAGYCVGQDISDRRLQFQDKPPQFSLGKSRESFGPIGPWLTSLDELVDPNDLAISCTVSGERVQSSRTRELIFGVPELVAFLSRHCTLAPGDLIFTGTPAGVGSLRTPRRYLDPDDVIETEIEGLGRLVNRCVRPEPR
jgi:2-keto-4-pentenoate hydratase/2-oxohepta-3-ene-1,7-dioic acid hydratase in catechol pathway